MELIDYKSKSDFRKRWGVNRLKNDVAKKLIEQNNILREQLTPENKTYYEEILLYMRTFGFFYEELETEQHLMTILQDILEAQEHGETAEEFFGNNPKEIVDQLTKQFDKPSWKSIFKISGIIFLISMFYTIFSSFSRPVLQVNGFVLLLDGIFSVAWVYGVFKLLHLSIYIKKQFPKFIKFIVLWLLVMVSIGSFVLIQFFAPKQGIVKIGAPFDWIAILTTLIIATAYVIFKRKQEYYGGLAFVICGVIFGLLLRIPQTREFLHNGKNAIFLFISTFLPIVLFFLVEWLLQRKREDKKQF